jgi:hypothetical protein
MLLARPHSPGMTFSACRVSAVCFRYASGSNLAACNAAASIGNCVEKPGVGWWWMQSDSNPSPPSNSLLTGKLTGNFAKFSISARIQGPGHEQIQWLAAKFPTHRTGNYFRRNREFWLRNRESFFPDQIQIISAQPDRNRHRPAWTRPREHRAGARANHGS